MKLTLEEGQVIDTIVTSIEDYGIWVKWKKWKGLVRDIDLQWEKIEVKTSDFSRVNEHLTVFILSFNGESGFFYGSLKHLEPEKNPWRNPDIYKRGNIMKGTVLQKCEYGYKILLETGAVAVFEKKYVTEEVEINSTMEFKIESVNKNREHIVLSIGP